MSSHVVRDRITDALLQTDRVSLVALVFANVFPLIGVLALGWNAGEIVLLYWWENLIVGAYAVLRMTLAKMNDRSLIGGKLFMIPFFFVHYGGFCAVHGIFLLAMFAGDDVADNAFPDGPHFWLGPLVFVELLFGVVGAAWAQLGMGALVALTGMAVSHGVSFVQNYLRGGEWRKATYVGEMFRPYGRIVLLHICVIFGAFLVVLLGSPLLMVALLVLVKTAVDVAMHVALHQSATDPAADADATASTSGEKIATTTEP
jgi:hypothetical protein